MLVLCGTNIQDAMLLSEPVVFVTSPSLLINKLQDFALTCCKGICITIVIVVMSAAIDIIEMIVRTLFGSNALIYS